MSLFDNIYFYLIDNADWVCFQVYDIRMTHLFVFCSINVSQLDVLHICTLVSNYGFYEFDGFSTPIIICISWSSDNSPADRTPARFPVARTAILSAT